MSSPNCKLTVGDTVIEAIPEFKSTGDLCFSFPAHPPITGEFGISWSVTYDKYGDIIVTDDDITE